MKIGNANAAQLAANLNDPNGLVKPSVVQTVPQEAEVSTVNAFEARSLIDGAGFRRETLFQAYSSSNSLASSDTVGTAQFRATETTSAGSAADATGAVELSPEEQQRVATENAPVFIFHSEEDYYPGDPVLAIEGNDPNSFSDNATVDGRRVTIQGTPCQRPAVDENDNPITDENGNQVMESVVLDQEGNVMIDENETPLIHATQIPPDKYMEIQEKNPGDPENAPVLYQYNEGPPPSMTYWIFSPYNDGYNKHQGDWESVTVEFGVNADGTLGEPVSVSYSSHGHSVTLPYELAPKEDGRLIVYVGDGSHAMSPYTGERPTKAPVFNDHFDAGGYRLDAAGQTENGESRLRNVEDEPWYGMQARWGQKGTTGFDRVIWGSLETMNDGVRGPSETKTAGGDERTPAEREADEMILRHAQRDENGNVIYGENGRPIINYEALAAEAANIARTDPEGSADLITALGDRCEEIAGEGDEFAQEFVDNLYPDGSDNVYDSELAAYANTEAGARTLNSISKYLREGDVHQDEANDHALLVALLAETNYPIYVDAFVNAG